MFTDEKNAMFWAIYKLISEQDEEICLSTMTDAFESSGNEDYIDIAQRIGIDTIINKKLITASYITRFTMDAEVTDIKCLSSVDADALEFVVKEGSPVTRKPIKGLKIPRGAIIGGIIRGAEGYIAVGDFQIKAGDKVVVFSLPRAVQKITTLFK
jgi:trk system potassium uptake protein TrkA